PLLTSASGRSKSLPDLNRSDPSKRSHAAGSSSAPLHGSDATAVSPRTSKQPSPAPRPGSWLPVCACSLDVSQGLELMGIILSQTLRSGAQRGVSKDGQKANGWRFCRPSRRLVLAGQG